MRGVVQGVVRGVVVGVAVAGKRSDRHVARQFLLDGQRHFAQMRRVGRAVRVRYETLALVVGDHVHPVVFLVEHVHHLERNERHPSTAVAPY